MQARDRSGRGHRYVAVDRRRRVTFGFAYLFIPLITIAVFSSTTPTRQVQHRRWSGFTWEQLDAPVQGHGVTPTPSSCACGWRSSSCTLATVARRPDRPRAGPLPHPRRGDVVNLLLVLPLTTPEIVIGASLFTLFFNQGVERGFWTIVIAHTMFCLSFVALTVKARIRGLDWSLEDAAADLGSPPLRTFFKITFPLIIPGDRRPRSCCRWRCRSTTTSSRRSSPATCHVPSRDLRLGEGRDPAPGARAGDDDHARRRRRSSSSARSPATAGGPGQARR